MHPLTPLITILASGVLSAFTGWLSSRVNVAAQLAMNARKLRAALSAELRMLHERLIVFEEVFATRVVTGKLPGPLVVEALVQDHDMAVFLDSASGIGLLDSRTGLEVLRFYADLRTLRMRGALLAEIAEGRGRPLEVEQQAYLAMIRRIRRRAHKLMRRLRAARPARWRLLLRR